MTQQIINVGPAPNDGLGDPIRTAFIKSNSNFTQLYERAQPTPPSTLIGSVGDTAGMYAYSSTYFYYCFANYNGTSVIWAEVNQAGNISASQIMYGNSSVTIATPGSNVSIGVTGTSNVAVFSPTGASINGFVSATGNITSTNLIVTNNISAVGNIIGSYILGNGSQLTGIVSSYSNADVSSYLPYYPGTLSPYSISTDRYFYANGSPFIGNYGNANVAAYLPTYTGNLAIGNLTVANNVSLSNITVTGNANISGNINGNLTGTTTGIHVGYVNSIDINQLSFDFGYIAANTYTNPLQYLFAVTSVGNIDMGTILLPTSLYIDIGILTN